MSKFDQKVNEILSEGLLRAAGNFLAAAQSPKRGIETIAGALKTRAQEKEDRLNQTFSEGNPPIHGQKVVTIAPVLGVGKKEKNPDFEPDILKRKPNASPREIEHANREFLVSKLTTLVPQATIKGVITTHKLDENGLYGVQLADLKYIFAQTESHPYWQVYEESKVPTDDVLLDEKGIPMVLKAIKTGLAAENVSPELKNWKDYNQFIKQTKNPKR
jgi:hypothetical protein